jgi:predicted nucleic acid-binding protein
VGTGGVIEAVADAGPLIHLTEINCLPLLRLFGTLHVPDGVWSETVEQDRVQEIDISGLANIRRHTLPQVQVAQFIRQNGLDKLQAGEVECLYLCGTACISTLLTDDLAVREVARSLHLSAVGSLGIIVRAYRERLITLADAERHITELYDLSSLFVTRAIIALAIEQLRARSFEH